MPSYLNTNMRNPEVAGGHRDRFWVPTGPERTLEIGVDIPLPTLSPVVLRAFPEFTNLPNILADSIKFCQETPTSFRWIIKWTRLHEAQSYWWLISNLITGAKILFGRNAQDRNNQALFNKILSIIGKMTFVVPDGRHHTFPVTTPTHLPAQFLGGANVNFGSLPSDWFTRLTFIVELAKVMPTLFSFELVPSHDEKHFAVAMGNIASNASLVLDAKLGTIAMSPHYPMDKKAHMAFKALEKRTPQYGMTLTGGLRQSDRRLPDTRSLQHGMTAVTPVLASEQEDPSMAIIREFTSAAAELGEQIQLKIGSLLLKKISRLRSLLQDQPYLDFSGSSLLIAIYPKAEEARAGLEKLKAEKDLSSNQACELSSTVNEQYEEDDIPELAVIKLIDFEHLHIQSLLPIHQILDRILPPQSMSEYLQMLEWYPPGLPRCLEAERPDQRWHRYGYDVMNLHNGVVKGLWIFEHTLKKRLRN